LVRVISVQQEEQVMVSKFLRTNEEDLELFSKQEHFDKVADEAELRSLTPWFGMLKHDG
jgi:hypothetical protein